MTPVSVERSASRSEEVRRQHRDAWLIVLAAGCLIILFGNLLGIGPWWLASAVAACMVVYGIFVARQVDDADVPGDTKGESIYYLGLLFTFAALVAALITFDWGAPGGDASGTTGAIRNFGIALLTTIVGLAGRVWFTMSQESPGDIEDTARSRLEETVTRMKESLDRARDDLDIMADRFRDSSAGLGEMAETIAEGAKNAAGTYGALDEYAGSIASATQALTGEMRQLGSVCTAGTRAMAALQDRAERLGLRFTEVQARLAEVHGTLDLVHEVAEPAAERVGATLRGVESTGAAVSELGETLAGVRRGAERAERALAGIADAVDRHEVLPLWRDAVEQLHAGTRGIRGIARHAGEMNAAFEGLKVSVKTASDGLATVPAAAREIDERLRGLEPELTASIAPVRRLARELNADLEAAGERSAELAGTLAGARHQARGLATAMRGGAGMRKLLARAVARTSRIRQGLAGMRRALPRLVRLRRKS